MIMAVPLQIYLCVVIIATLVLIANIAGNIKRIADRIELRESNYAKGYEQGYKDAKRYYE